MAVDSKIGQAQQDRPLLVSLLEKYIAGDQAAPGPPNSTGKSAKRNDLSDDKHLRSGGSTSGIGSAS